MFDGVIWTVAGIVAGSRLAATLDERREILHRSDASHEAVMTPRDPGGLSTALRATLATRIAVRNADPRLADHYRAMLEADTGRTPELLRLASPEEAPTGDAWLVAVVRHADLLTMAPQDSGAPEVEALRAAGVVDADIVRLTQLVGFLSYQVRLAAALRLLQDT